jgi:hypothetical protein
LRKLKFGATFAVAKKQFPFLARGNTMRPTTSYRLEISSCLPLPEGRSTVIAKVGIHTHSTGKRFFAPTNQPHTHTVKGKKFFAPPGNRSQSGKIQHHNNV